MKLRYLLIALITLAEHPQILDLIRKFTERCKNAEAGAEGIEKKVDELIRELNELKSLMKK